MLKVSDFPFTEGVVSRHPSLAHRGVWEVTCTTLNKFSPEKIFDRYLAESQSELQEVLRHNLGFLATDSSTNVVQVGAHDGVSDDPLFHYLIENQWSAVLVEPTDDAFTALKALHGKRPKTTLVNKAVTPNGDPITLFVPTIIGFEVFGSVWTSTNIEQVEREIKRNIGRYVLKNNTRIDEIEIPGISPAALMESANLRPDQVNLLVIDIEGQDPPVVNAFLDAGVLPEVLLYEHFHANKKEAKELNARLSDEGYQLIHSVKDTLALL